MFCKGPRTLLANWVILGTPHSPVSAKTLPDALVVLKKCHPFLDLRSGLALGGLQRIVRMNGPSVEVV